ncbi:unnamed protein product, partial [Mesorhabditis belari]|uniref:Biopterin-dependent aromatic amino acid hydroxylase family profile domain-containing protein n=1 Tax=Mesorhabditis belari TaxID=2138241 RepID=A0AAF3EFB1_9BILA
MLQRGNTIVTIPEDGEKDELNTGRKAPPKMTRRYSLVHQASIERFANEGLKRGNTVKRRQQLQGGIPHGKQILQRLNDEGVDLIWAADCTSRIHFAAILTSSGEIPCFMRTILDSFTKNGISIEHLETRPHKRKQMKTGMEKAADGWDIICECVATKDQLLAAATELVTSHEDLKNISIYKSDKGEEIPWFPRHISELDQCSKCVTKYEPTTDPRHPGHGDATYIARRQFLNDQAVNFRHGDPIPYVEYTKEEHATWKAVYEKLKTLHESHTCLSYRKNLKMLEEEGVLTAEKIPQIVDVNKYLMRKTGFMLRPCSGLLSARDFLASLAYRVFQTTTYLRHHGSPHHSPEPDLVHELLGHVPMFSDPLIAQMSQDIGLMSLGATDDQIEKLATVYWFIIEFGLCREDGKLKAIGAGLLSAYGELMHACSDVPDHKEFDPRVTAVQTYEDSDYQPLYFVAHSLQDALIKLREYASSMPRSYGVIYDPLTQSVRLIKKVEDVAPAFERFHLDLSGIMQSLHVGNRTKASNFSK